MKNNIEQLKSKLLKLREQPTIAEIAREIGYDRRSLDKWLNGERGLPEKYHAPLAEVVKKLTSKK